MKLLTIFTPTYNRARLLKRLYDSLCSQSSYNFEWIVIDDESKDDTKEIIQSIAKNEQRFPIMYYRQQHGGKHRAINAAVKIAQGDYFFIVDSDDYLKKETVELINIWTEAINDKNTICGVAGLRVSSSGFLYGGSGLADKEKYIEASNLERKRLKLLGDKAEIYSTEILKKYPFPEFEGEFFVTENVCWNAIAADGYKLRWYNVPIYECDYLEDGLTRTGANERVGHIKNINGYAYYVKQSLKVCNPLDSITEFREYNRSCSEMGININKRAQKLRITPIDYIILLLVKMPFLYGLRLFTKYVRRNT